MNAGRRAGRTSVSFRAGSLRFIRPCYGCFSKERNSRENAPGCSTSPVFESIPAGRARDRNASWTRGFRVVPLSGSDAITITLGGDRLRSFVGGSSELPTTH
jgi:hypothetical protein